jgi:hypothetical protein
MPAVAKDQTTFEMFWGSKPCSVRVAVAAMAPMSGGSHCLAFAHAHATYVH